MGGGSISLLYVIDHKRYREYLDKGKLKYVFPVFTPTFKSKILDHINTEEDKNIKIAGINLKEVNYNDKNVVHKMIKRINKLKDEETKVIYIEDLIESNLEIKNRIEIETGLYFPKENRSRIYNIKTILEKILNIKPSLKDKEVLIICNDKAIICNIIELLHERFLFISIFESMGQGEIICGNVLNDIGLSIFIQKDVNKTIDKYDIIINMEKNVNIDIDNIKKEAIIFDFSDKHKFRKTKNKILIEDITIKNKNIENGLISNEITSALYENLGGDYSDYFHRIYSRGRYLTFDELISSKMEIRGCI